MKSEAHGRAVSNPTGLLILPLALTLVFILFLPFLQTIMFSFTNYDLSTGGNQKPFVGPVNYWRAFHDSNFLTSIFRSLAFSLPSLVIELGLGFVLAVWLARNHSLTRKLLPVLAVPSLLAPILVGLLWVFLLNSRFGPLILIARSFGFSNAQSPFGMTALAMPALIAVDVWQWTPFVAILLFAGIGAVPRRYMEAAALDGATQRQIVRTIILPQLRPTILAIVVIRVIDLLKEFDKVYILTGGGPSDSTELVSIYIWRIGFKYWSISYASTLSLLVYVVIALMCYAIVKSVGVPQNATKGR